MTTIMFYVLIWHSNSLDFVDSRESWRVIWSDARVQDRVNNPGWRGGQFRPQFCDWPWGRKPWQIGGRYERTWVLGERSEWSSLQRGKKDKWCAGRNCHVFFCLLLNLMVFFCIWHPKYISKCMYIIYKYRNGNTWRLCSFFLYGM